MSPVVEYQEQSYNNKVWVLLSPPGVFSCIETGQVFVLLEDIHLFIGPKKKKKVKNMKKETPLH